MKIGDLEQTVRAALAERYSAPVVRVADDTVQVLAGAALDLARQAAAAAGVADPERRIVAIDHASLAWQLVPGGGLELWRQHGQRGDAGERVTELAAGDPAVQVVADHAGWVLVRTADGATGWLAPDGPRPAEPAPAPPELGSLDVVDPDALAREAAALLGVPYRWGGTTASGVDCSGLVQRAAWNAGACWLPRHSTALLRVGARAPVSGIGRGDVLVLRRSGMPDGDDAPARPVGDSGPAVHPMHVALALDEVVAIHASRDAWKVVTEPIADLRERYRVLSVRRPGTALAAGTTAPSRAAEQGH